MQHLVEKRNQKWLVQLVILQILIAFLEEADDKNAIRNGQGMT